MPQRYHRSMGINRCRILMPDGPQQLTIPLVAESTRGTLDDILISEHGRWRSHHWNALQTAYGKTPFFEFYADDFRPLFTEVRPPRLADFNAALHAIACRLIDIPCRLTGDGGEDGGGAGSADSGTGAATGGYVAAEVRYYQVFAQRLGFQPHMSVIDLLCNMGPESVLVLQAMAQGCRPTATPAHHQP